MNPDHANIISIYGRDLDKVQNELCLGNQSLQTTNPDQTPG